MTAQLTGLLNGTTSLLIDGHWEPSPARLEVLDKYTRQPFAVVAQASPADVGRAVTGALAAAQRPLPPARRQEILAETARLLDTRRDEIRALYVAETGFTPADAATELARAVATLRLSAEEAVRIVGQEVPVAADADLELVADLVVRAGYRKAGQVCTSVQRLLVQHAVADELAARLAKRVAALRAGDPRDPDVQVGPLIAPAEAERAESWIQQAAGRGAAVLAGGERDGPVLAPALLRDPPPDSRIMTEEIFAPAVALTGVDTLDQAIDLVNRGDYGLQAGVFTQDLDAAFHAARRLRVGGVMINDTSSYHADAMPYGGVKNSGYGLEGPAYAVQDMTDPRIIVLNLRERP